LVYEAGLMPASFFYITPKLTGQYKIGVQINQSWEKGFLQNPSDQYPALFL